MKNERERARLEAEEQRLNRIADVIGDKTSLMILAAVSELGSQLPKDEVESYIKSPDDQQSFGRLFVANLLELHEGHYRPTDSGQGLLQQILEETEQT